jgi:ABC-type methionine transport system ATPase subunit
VSDSIAIVMRGVSREVAGGVDGASDRVRLLDGIDLTLARGELLNVVGPSGSGKSSLIRLLNRLDEATGGRIEILGREIGEWPVRELRTRVGMSFQEPTLLERTVRANLRLPFELCGRIPEDFEARADEARDDAGVAQELLDRDESRLSVGQKQRVALARALITRPELLLLDEPTSSLDPRAAERLLDRLAMVKERRRLTVVMVTHRLSEARRVGGKMAVLISGRIETVGPALQLLDDPPTSASREFLLGDDHESR